MRWVEGGFFGCPLFGKEEGLEGADVVVFVIAGVFDFADDDVIAVGAVDGDGDFVAGVVVQEGFS